MCKKSIQKKLFEWLLTMLLAVTTIQGVAQNSITFIITQTPPYTPKNDTLYLSSSLDN